MTAKAMARTQGELQLPFPVSRRGAMTALAVLLAGVAIWRVQTANVLSHWLPITKVQVAGEMKWVDQEKMRNVIKPFMQAGFFNADLQGLKESVEQLQWVKAASVRRIWPGTLRVEVQEQQAIARWDNVYLLNREGQLFQPDTLPKQLVHLQGPPGMHKRIFGLYQQLQELFTQYNLKITNVGFNERHALHARLSGGMTFLFGRLSAANDPYAMLRRFFVAYENGLGGKMDQIKQVDLRYTNGFAVRWRNKISDNDKYTGRTLTG